MLKNDAIAHTGILNRIGNKWNRLHGRMVTVFLRLIKLPYGSLLSVGVPLMLAFLFPTVKAWLMLPLIWTPTKH